MSTNAVRAGVLAAAVLGLFYVLVVGGFGGIAHLGQQAADDWPWLVLILTGFGTQVALFVELRRRHRAHDVAMKTAAGGGAGASTVGMVACCAHHVVDLAPIIGVSGVAVFLTDYRVPIMLAGIAVNALGVVLAAQRLRLDMAASARLRVDGTTTEGASWDGQGPGGHHREGTLRFTVAVPAGANVELRITGLPADTIASWSAP